MRLLLMTLGVALVLAACTTQPPPQILLRPDVTAPLPDLPTLRGPWQASQLLTVQARGQEERLQMEIDLSGDKLTIIAFAAWGARVLTVTYDGRHVTADVTGPAVALPPPPQIVADVLLVNWPVRTWALPQGWRLDQQLDFRRVRDGASRVVTEVRYPLPDTQDDILLINNAYNYRLSIRTLSGDLPIR